MRDLLPGAVAVAVADASAWAEEPLPEEAATLSERAVPARRREFRAGRACARRAMTALGLPPLPVPAGRDRAPVWPARVVGSISHTGDYCAAAVARADRVRSIGIDAEDNLRLDEPTRRLVCREEEEEWWHGPGGEAPYWPTVFFSAKEAVYKAWFPLVGGWLGFHDVRVEPDPATGTFTARVLVPRPPGPAPEVLHGRFAVSPGLVRTAVVVTP
ncbi:MULTISPECIES: 4'-phosphopantetheinyl transferase family protein [unclassified Streptomyces]|uniref:4'-phosphopantetheinyl transferase family protein n=1 Tax=unclassified Streptomyces TaxID=2593676 RepID=UPI0006ADB3B5|nr:MULTISPECIES: 4'-phosphopantetheinyl transferase superfamily protein [unclassified Streptomyces]KOX23568.1 4-phosphopantetheinyl transferase [Streptomyces sp. NRRL F-6491]KOX40362.1 4-phosphopantetheinyl transferase [Streptomyces sp. NRRL F-6492]